MKQFLIVLALPIIFLSCDDSKDLTNEELVIGTWIPSAFDYNFTIDGRDWKEYYKNEYGYSDEEIAEAEENNSLNLDSIDLKFLKIESDHSFTYENKEDPSETGTWSLLENGSVLLLDDGFSDEFSPENEDQRKILSLTKSKMVLSFEEWSQFDFDDNGVDEVWVIEYIFSFKK